MKKEALLSYLKKYKKYSKLTLEDITDSSYLFWINYDIHEIEESFTVYTEAEANDAVTAKVKAFLEFPPFGNTELNNVLIECMNFKKLLKRKGKVLANDRKERVFIYNDVKYCIYK